MRTKGSTPMAKEPPVAAARGAPAVQPAPKKHAKGASKGADVNLASPSPPPSRGAPLAPLAPPLSPPPASAAHHSVTVALPPPRIASNGAVQRNTISIVTKIHTDIKARRKIAHEQSAQQHLRASVEEKTLERSSPAALPERPDNQRQKEEAWKKISYGLHRTAPPTSSTGKQPQQRSATPDPSSSSGMHQRQPGRLQPVQRPKTRQPCAEFTRGEAPEGSAADAPHRHSRSLSISQVRPSNDTSDVALLQTCIAEGSTAAAKHFAETPFRVRLHLDQQETASASPARAASPASGVRGSSRRSLRGGPAAPGGTVAAVQQDVVEFVRAAAVRATLLARLAGAVSPNDARLSIAWVEARKLLGQQDHDEYMMCAWGYMEHVQWVVVQARQTQEVTVAIASDPVPSGFVESFNTTCPWTSKTFVMGNAARGEHAAGDRSARPASDPLDLFATDAVQCKMLEGMLGLEGVARQRIAATCLGLLADRCLAFDERVNRLMVERRFELDLLLSIPRRLRLSPTYKSILYAMVDELGRNCQLATLWRRFNTWARCLNHRRAMANLREGIAIMPTILSNTSERDVQDFVAKRMVIEVEEAWHLWVMYTHTRKFARSKQALEQSRRHGGNASASASSYPSNTAEEAADIATSGSDAAFGGHDATTTRSVSQRALELSTLVAGGLASTMAGLELRGNIVLVGHGVGGAIAVLTALLLNESIDSGGGVQVGHVITIGAPRVFLMDPQDLLEANGIELLSVSHVHDPGPHHPTSFAPSTEAPFLLSPSGGISCAAWSDAGQVPAAAQLFWRQFHAVDGYLAALRGVEGAVAVPHEPKCFAARPLKVHGFSPIVVKALQAVFVKYCAAEASKVSRDTVLAMCSAIHDPRPLPMHWVQSRVPAGRGNLIDFPLFLTWVWEEAQASSMFLHGLFAALRVRFNPSKQDYDVDDRRELPPYKSMPVHAIAPLLPPPGIGIALTGPMHHLFRHAARTHNKSPLERSRENQPTVSRDCVVQLLLDGEWTERYTAADAVDYLLVRMAQVYVQDRSSDLFTFAGDLTRRGFLRLMRSLHALNPVAFENAMFLLGYSVSGVHILSDQTTLRDLHWKFGPCQCMKHDRLRTAATLREEQQLKWFTCDYAAARYEEVMAMGGPPPSGGAYGRHHHHMDAPREQLLKTPLRPHSRTASPNSTMNGTQPVTVAFTCSDVAQHYAHNPRGELESLLWHAEQVQQQQQQRTRVPTRKETRREYVRYLEGLDISTSIGKKPKHCPPRGSGLSAELSSGQEDVFLPTTNSDTTLRAAYHPANILRLLNAAQRKLMHWTPLRNRFIEDVSSDDESGSSDGGALNDPSC